MDTLPMTKANLAMELGYDSSQCLFRLVHQDKQVMELLVAVGYRRRQRNLTPHQVNIIIKYIGLAA